MKKNLIINSTYDKIDKSIKRKLLVIISISLCSFLFLTLGLMYIFAKKIDPIYNQVQNVNVVNMLNNTISKSIKESLKNSYFEQDGNTKNSLSTSELDLFDYYQSDNFFDQLNTLLYSGGYNSVPEFLFEKLNNYLSSAYTNEDVLQAKVMQRDYFVGVSKSQSECINLWNSIESIIADIIGTTLDIYDLASIIWDVIMASSLASTASGAVSAILGTLKAILAAIPIVGWIALALIAGVEVTILITMLVKGSQNKGFRVGVDVKTGFLGIPTGIKWICE